MVMDKKEYIRANKEWLAKKSKEEGVLPLSKGVCYKVIASGDPQGKSPALRSIITVHYTGCTIDGKQFDSSRDGVPLAIRLSDVIEGWVIALQQMHVGDRWEVYIPAACGYGKLSLSGIPAGSTLVFDIELIGVA